MEACLNKAYDVWVKVPPSQANNTVVYKKKWILFVEEVSKKYTFFFRFHG